MFSSIGSVISRQGILMQYFLDGLLIGHVVE